MRLPRAPFRARAWAAACAGAGLGLAALLGASPARADPPELEVTFTGPECRVRAEGPLGCAVLPRLSIVRGETAVVQIVLEARAELQVAPRIEAPLAVEVLRQIFVPVRARSRGRAPDGDALPWSAAARPPDAQALGELADPLCPPDGAPLRLAPGRREALWLRVRGDRPGTSAISLALPGGRQVELAVDVLDATLPRSPARFFAYVERDELAKGADDASREAARDRLFDELSRRGVTPIDRATDPGELAGQLRPLPASAGRDLVVLGAYGTLGEPAEGAVDRALAMADLVPPEVEHVVLHVIDEECGSDLGARWRRALDARGERGRRVRTLLTCGDDPAGVAADVVAQPAERFDPARAAAARARGREVWVYNGRLPQAGTMALDAPPESLLWPGWIAARHDVGRWFWWNVDHWSDGNRGGLGPRDPYADPETFHNADGDAVLLDGLLFFPPPGAARARSLGCVEPGAPLATARLERLARGAEDAALLVLAASIDPAAAQRILARVVPAALADVPDGAPARFAAGAELAAARAALHEVVARRAASGPVPVLDAPSAARVLGELRRGAAAAAPPPGREPRRTWLGTWLVLVLVGGAALAALRRARRRPRREGGAAGA